jgi:hypothetical protein
MFPGDLERAGFLALLNRDDFKQALRETNVYVAAHHGRASGCCEEAAALLTKVFYVVISDTYHQYETQNTLAFYGKIAKGGPFRGTHRSVLTTRRDGEITFQFSRGRWWPE